MRCIFAVTLAVVLVVAEGKVLPASDVETQQTANQPMSMADFISQAQTALSNIGNQIQEKINLTLPNQDELFNTLKDQSNSFATNVQQYLHTMSEEVKNKNPELENIWTNFKNKLNEVVDNISVNSETTEQLNQLRAKFQDGVQAIVTESENAAKSISENSEKLREDFAKMSKNAIDIAVQASQNLNNQLQQAASHAQS